ILLGNAVIPVRDDLFGVDVFGLHQPCLLYESPASGCHLTLRRSMAWKMFHSMGHNRIHYAVRHHTENHPLSTSFLQYRGLQRGRRTPRVRRGGQQERGTSGRWPPSPARACSARPSCPVCLPPVSLACLLDHLVCQKEQGWGYRYPQPLGGLWGDDQLELLRPL